MRLSTCARDGATIRRVVPDSGALPYWEHVNPALDTHVPDPDDGWVSGPDREPCPACGHDHEDEDFCGELVGSGRYGTDGVEVERRCSCTGPVCAETLTLPVNGQVLRCSASGAHGDGEHIFDATPSSPDPWIDPDAAAAAVPPPF